MPSASTSTARATARRSPATAPPAAPQRSPTEPPPTASSPVLVTQVRLGRVARAGTQEEQVRLPQDRVRATNLAAEIEQPEPGAIEESDDLSEGGGADINRYERCLHENRLDLAEHGGATFEDLEL